MQWSCGEYGGTVGSVTEPRWSCGEYGGVAIICGETAVNVIELQQSSGETAVNVAELRWIFDE